MIPPAGVPLRATRCDVDLDAIAANCGAVAARAGTAVIAVVKADAYGHGGEAVAETALAAGAAMLAVATIEEAFVLRCAGIAAPILVLLGASDRDEADAAVALGLTLAVWDAPGARIAGEAARAAGVRLAVHFKVDTGLTRLGAPLDRAAAGYALIAGLPGIRLEGVYTHLATADEPDETTAREQLARFAAFVGALPERPPWVHALASAGVAAFGPLAGCTAVRAGLALYGIAAAPHLALRLPLTPALTWRTAVLRLAEVPRGTGVAYGHEYRLAHDGRLATLAVGYADGLPRSAWPRGRVLLAGGVAPVAGRVSMDLTVVDVSELGTVRVGDEAVLVGARDGVRQTATDLATACGTLAYELVAGVRARVPRRYHREGRVVATKTLAGGYRRC